MRGKIVYFKSNLKMKFIKSVCALLILTLLVASCSQSHEVITGKHIQKRKYLKGYHVNKKTKKAESNFSLTKSKKKEYKKLDAREIHKKSIIDDAVDQNKSENTISNSSEDGKTVNGKNKKPAYFDNTLRDQIEDRLGKSKDKVRKRLKKKSTRIMKLLPEADGTPSTDSHATASFIMALVGLLIFGIILGLLAMIFGIISLGRINKSGGTLKGVGFATAGIIIGFIDVVALLFLLSTL